jgi:hypothetical protein
MGDLLVLNQNWDPGWRADGESALNYHDAVATHIHAKDGEITFRYVPRFFYLGCLLLVMTVAALVWFSRLRVRLNTA